MYWLLMLIPGGLIALNVFFEKRQKQSKSNEEVGEYFKTKGAANKAADPKHSKMF
ncbi:hypothetical protein LCM20_00210 [Halobacillus litoralis]|uniref:hypothetical protein n=1 Tax=Halobacillus litoralis TaxID=45668 RepID=UPI001CD4F7AB|nr:hypothetical protein [Halobacillus litoralis]MCA0969005.1 hypothetical protein [Halobacillus litoralis]